MISLKIKQYLKYSFWTYILISILFKCVIFLGFTLDASHLSADIPQALGKAFPFLPYHLGIIAFLFSFAFLFKNKLHQFFLLFLDLLISSLFLVDLWYFRGFKTMPSVLALNQTGNLSSLQDVVLSLIHPVDFIMIIDIPVILFLMLILSIIKKDPFKEINRSIILFAAVFTISSGIIALIPFRLDIGNKKVMNPQTASIRLSPLGYHAYNIYSVWRGSQAAELTSSEMDDIQLWFSQKNEILPDNNYKGLLAGKNLIFIQVESLEKFVIGQKYEGQEVTPNLNKLLKNSLFFSNIYEQNNQGNSSDADLMYNTSIFPVRDGSTFFTYPNTTYPGSMPNLLRKMGYSTLAMHPDEGTFWNWMPSLKSIGFQELIGAEHFVMDETFLLGLSDESFFKQAAPYVINQKQPFYTFMVTQSSHSPFNIPYYHRTLDLKNGYNENIMEFYFQSVHYTDECIGNFLKGLDEKGLLENTVVVICGDHAGVNKYHKADIQKVEPREPWFELSKQQIPFIIYSKNLPPEEFNITGGQIDVLPTLTYLMGVDNKSISNTAIGRNLLNTKREFAVLADGTYVGSASNDREKELEVKGLDIADTIIKNNYFKKSDSAQALNTEPALHPSEN